MSMKINPNNGDNYEKNSVVKSTEKNNVILKSVFDIDKLGNNNGQIEEEDFTQALENKKWINYRILIENFYREFMVMKSEIFNTTNTIGNYDIIEMKAPFSPKGSIEKIKVVRDKNTQKTLSQTKTIITENNGTKTVTVEITKWNGDKTSTKTTSFDYNQNLLEYYVINQGVDKKGNKIEYFKNIPEIRSLPESERTSEQKNKLEEFDNLISYVIDSGIEYGVDPKAILAIIQEEVCFKGLTDKASSNKGKGYMQLTTIAVADMLNGIKNCHNYKTAEFTNGLNFKAYGTEIIELFTSRGFDIQNAKTTNEKRELLRRVMNYLIKNKDPEFNIKLGTIKLRQTLNKFNDDFKKAAEKYNASDSAKKYSERTFEYFSRMLNSQEKLNKENGLT